MPPAPVPRARWGVNRNQDWQGSVAGTTCYLALPGPGEQGWCLHSRETAERLGTRVLRGEEPNT